MKTVNTFQLLKAMLLIAPKSDIRYYMNGVSIRNENGVVIVTATDGHSLLQVRLNGNEEGVLDIEEGKHAILDHASATRILKLYTKKTPPEIVLREGMAFFGNAEVETIDGRFPDVDRVVRQRTEKTRSADAQGIRLDLISRVAKAASMLTEYSTCTMHDANGYKLFRETDAGTITALIMPARV